MDVAEITEACRLCPIGGTNQQLINVFEERGFEKKNMREIILVTTGVEISESDIISKKICQKCYKHAQKIYQIRQIAAKQDKVLKKMSVKLLEGKGIRLPNTCITMKRNVQTPKKSERKLVPLAEAPCLEPAMPEIIEESKPRSPLIKFNSTMKPIKGLHKSIIDVYRRFPKFKLPKKCIDRHMAPIISLTMGEVEKFFKENKLEMNKFIYRSHHGNNQARIKCNRVARKKTATPVKSVAELRASKKKTPEISGEICDLLNVVVNEADYRRPSEVPNIPVIRQSTERRGRPTKFIRSHLNMSSSPVKTVSVSPLKNCLEDTDTDKKEVIESTITNIIFNQLDDSSAEKSVSVAEPKEEHDAETIIEAKDSSEIKMETNPRPQLKRRMLLLPNSTYQKMCKVFEVQYPSSTISIETEHNENVPLPSNEPHTSAEPTNNLATSPPAGLSNTSKPDFIQSLGLAPAGEAIVPKSILICKICGSVHKNVTSLKTHSSRHRICPHCKLKFKSVERKQNHIDNDCETKKILESSGSFVSLMKVELDNDLREEYKEAFYNADMIPRPDEQIVIQDDEDDNDEIILISDEVLQKGGEDIMTKETGNSEPEQPIESVFIIKPIIKIHNNTMLDELENNPDEKEFLKDLMYLFRQKYPVFQSIQTDQPKGHDVVFEENGRCRLKNLKQQLLTYNVPVSFQNGNLSVSFKPYTQPPSKKVNLDSWNDLPLIDKPEPPAITTQPPINQSYPVTFVQSSQLSLSSIQVMTATPTMSIILPNTFSIQGVNNSPHQTQFYNPATQQTTIQPVVQNYTIPINFPLMNNQLSMSSSSAATTTSPKKDSAEPESGSVSSSKSSSDAELAASPKTEKIKVKMARSLRLRKVWELD